MADIRPGMVSEIEFYHKNKKLIIKIIPGGYHRNKSMVEKKFGYHIAKSFGEAWDRIFPKPERVAHVDLASGPDQTVKTTIQKTEKGPILISHEVVPAGTDSSPLTIGENHG